MSNALAISGVTAILQYYLNNLYSNVQALFPTSVTVSCLAPDQVQQAQSSASGTENQVNIFMHQVTHNAAWRNVDLPSMSAGGKDRLKSPPLALDLHYLLTVYGSEYWQAEALLGYALMMLHEAPMLTRSDISSALTALSGLASGSSPFPNTAMTDAIANSGLAEQIEMIKITPATLGREEMAWLWTALKADYRPTFPFLVSVVLMQPAHQTSFALPVLLRRIKAQPIQPAQIIAIKPPINQNAAQPGDTVTITGEFLKEATRVVLSNARYDVQPLPMAATATNNSLTFVLPAVPPQYPAGMYDLVVQFLDSTNAIVQTTNSLPFAIAPILPTQTATVVANTQGKLVTINTFSPQAWEGQSIALALSNVPSNSVAPFRTLSAPALPFTGNATSLSFQFDSTLLSGAKLARLLVDGVPSQMQVDTIAFPPTFSGPMVTV